MRFDLLNRSFTAQSASRYMRCKTAESDRAWRNQSFSSPHAPARPPARICSSAYLTHFFSSRSHVVCLPLLLFPCYSFPMTRPLNLTIIGAPRNQPHSNRLIWSHPSCAVAPMQRGDTRACFPSNITHEVYTRCSASSFLQLHVTPSLPHTCSDLHFSRFWLRRAECDERSQRCDLAGRRVVPVPL
jgi:hypothetical protein